MFFHSIETDRLFLRNIAPQDRDFLLRQFSCDAVNRYLFDAEPMASLSEADELIGFYTQAEPRNQHRWILVRKADGTAMGTCGFHCWDRERGRCEMGYDLYPDFWGQGYMREALAAILRFAAESMGVSRIDAHIYPQNERSIRASTAQGFAFFGETTEEVFRGRSYAHRVYTLRIPAAEPRA